MFTLYRRRLFHFSPVDHYGNETEAINAAVLLKANGIKALVINNATGERITLDN